MECIENKIDFINQFLPLLKTGGLLVISHFDFDSACFFSSDKNFTRALIHSYADAPLSSKGAVYADGSVGRHLPGLIRQTNFKNYSYSLKRLAEERFEPGYYGYVMAEMLACFGAKNQQLFAAAKLDAWRANLQAKACNCEYFFAIDLFICALKN